MPNQPRADNPARKVRVLDPLWDAFRQATADNGTNPSEVLREAIQDYVDKHTAEANR